MQDHPALVDIPAHYVLLVPELDRLELPHEVRATCEDCPQQVGPGETPTADRPFIHDMVCCTYQPRIPNYMVGRVLDRGGVGADRMRARIRRLPGDIDPLGILPPASLKPLYGVESFGKDERLICPFWVPGPLSCSIWRDRNAVCRTWHCRTTDGPRGTALWDTVRDALMRIEIHLAVWAASNTEGMPEPGEDRVEVWEAWYRACFERFERATAEEILAVPMEEARGLEVALRVYSHLHGSPIPDEVMPLIAEVERDGDELVLTGYSRLDRTRVPRTFMALFGLLVEGTPWRDATARVREDYGIDFDDAFMEHLWRRGVLTWEPTGNEVPEVAAWLEIARAEGIELSLDAEVEPPVAE